MVIDVDPGDRCMWMEAPVYPDFDLTATLVHLFPVISVLLPSNVKSLGDDDY